jgi:hypothetical protein
MEARDATIHNADLWSHYLREQWSAWLDPFRLTSDRDSAAVPSGFADAAAASVASFLTMFVADPIGQMFDENAPEVTHALHEAAIAPESDAIPNDYLAAGTPAARGVVSPAVSHRQPIDQSAVLAF